MNVRRFEGLIILVAVGATVMPGRVPAAGGEAAVRPPQFAGTWYPGDAAALSTLVDDMLAKAATPEIRT